MRLFCTNAPDIPAFPLSPNAFRLPSAGDPWRVHRGRSHRKAQLSPLKSIHMAIDRSQEKRIHVELTVLESQREELQLAWHEIVARRRHASKSDHGSCAPAGLVPGCRLQRTRISGRPDQVAGARLRVRECLPRLLELGPPRTPRRARAPLEREALESAALSQVSVRADSRCTRCAVKSLNRPKQIE